MQLDEFKARVRRTFGEDLHRASPASVRDFLDQIQQDTHGEQIGEHRFHVDEPAGSYEEVMRSFFVHALDLPPEEAVTLLWTVALELSYAVIESRDAVLIGHLFRNLEDPSL